jgi:lipopolysaccharide biosynthesis glycosyltransferase
MATGLRKETASWLRAEVAAVAGGRVVPSEPDVVVQDVPCPLRTSAIFNRIYAIRDLPDLSRCVYLDLDTIVLDDLSKLFAMETGDCGLAGVLDYFEPTLAGQLNDFYLSGPHDTPVDPTIAAFNSGVLLMDFAKLRAADAFGWMRAQLAANYMIDQPLLNLYSGGRFHRLHGRWNRSANYIDPQAPLTEISILHWHGEKPWNGARPFQDVYDRYSPKAL